MKLRFIYTSYKGNKIEHDKFLHCNKQIYNQNLHAIEQKPQKRKLQFVGTFKDDFMTRRVDAKLS